MSIENVGETKKMYGMTFMQTGQSVVYGNNPGEHSVTVTYSAICPPCPTRDAESWRDALAAWCKRNDHIADASKMVKRMQACPNASEDPDCQMCRHRVEHDEDEGCQSTHTCGPCYPVPVAPQYERVEFRRDPFGRLAYLSTRGGMYRHVEALSEAGFAGYEYADGDVQCAPCMWQPVPGGTSYVVLPVAWRRVI